jgi:hypothetical protein
MNRPRRLWLQLSSLAIVLLLFGLVVLERTAISDWFRLYNYTPSAAATQLATDDTFTSTATHLYNINHAAIVPKSKFTAECTTGKTSEKTIVLGCYHSDQAGIFVLQITDDARLNGVEQVTAAHEMLHAAYDRLSKAERQQVDGWLNDYYEHDLTDARIKQTLEDYKTSEPGQLTNEMHSIFGTEIANLPQQLETYYQRYFTDRGKVAAYAASYQAEFTSRQAQVTAIDAQLDQLKAQIDQEEKRLKTAQQSLDSQQDALNNYRRNGQVAAYNAAVPSYNTTVDYFNSLVRKLKADIAQYNQLVSQHNSIAVEQQQLSQELSGDGVETIPKQ